jgi:hypothetical protein
MKIKKIKVPFYKWKIISIIIDNHKEKDEIVKVMEKYEMRKEDIDNIVDMMDSEAIGGAVCHYNDSKLLCVIITFPHNSIKSLVSTLIHEGRHATDRVIATTGIEGEEASAYLNEYITTKIVKDFIKNETNKI